MYQTRIVPWVNYQEFETVYQWLFADRKTQVDQVRRGIDRVQTWTNRGEIPSSVETTAALIEIIIHDEQSSHLSHKELRLTYAMALVRFVNGLVDREQKGKFAKSIQVLARSIGLPSWFVDLRHASTHEHLPSLMVLRDGAMQAVAWLHDHYWVRNLKKADQQNHDEIKSKLNQYKECRKSFMKEKYSAKSSDPDAYVACIQQLIEMIGYQEEQLQQDVIPLLLNVGGLVPTGKKKRASAEEMQISKGLIELWTPLIQGLDVGFPDFGRQLVKAMIKRLNINEEFKVNETLLNPYAAFATKEKTDDPTQAPSYLLTLTCWLRHFVQEFSQPQKQRTLTHLAMDDILDASLRHPNYYTRSVLHMVATVDTELGNSIKPFTRYIDQMIYKSIKEKSDEEILPLYKQEEQGLTLELDQLKSQLDHISNNNRKVPKKKRRLTKQDAMEVDETASHHWRLYENWKACPMGTLPNGKVPCLDLSVLLSTKE